MVRGPAEAGSRTPARRLVGKFYTSRYAPSGVPTATGSVVPAGAATGKPTVSIAQYGWIAHRDTHSGVHALQGCCHTIVIVLYSIHRSKNYMVRAMPQPFSAGGGAVCRFLSLRMRISSPSALESRAVFCVHLLCYYEHHLMRLRGEHADGGGRRAPGRHRPHPPGAFPPCRPVPHMARPRGLRRAAA